VLWHHLNSLPNRGAVISVAAGRVDFQNNISLLRILDNGDARPKKNNEPLRGALERLLALRGMTFEYTQPESVGERPGAHAGMIAQGVEKVIFAADDGFKRIGFTGFEALTVESLRELQAQNVALRRENAALRRHHEDLRSGWSDSKRS
jgi:hypothetical protein